MFEEFRCGACTSAQFEIRPVHAWLGTRGALRGDARILNPVTGDDERADANKRVERARQRKERGRSRTEKRGKKPATGGKAVRRGGRGTIKAKPKAKAH